LYDTDITVDNLEDNINQCDNMNLSSNFKSVEVQTETSYSNEEMLKNKIKILQQILRRKNKKIENLDDLVKSLKNDGHINSEQQHAILNNFNGKLLIFIYI
jgi:transcription elongation factor GreA-like protein